MALCQIEEQIKYSKLSAVFRMGGKTIMLAGDLRQLQLMGLLSTADVRILAGMGIGCTWHR